MRSTEIDGAFRDPGGKNPVGVVREAVVGEGGWWLSFEVFAGGYWGERMYFRLGKQPGNKFGGMKAPGYLKG